MKAIACILFILLFIKLPIKNHALDIVGHLCVGFVFGTLLLKKLQTHGMLILFFSIEVMQIFVGRSFGFDDIFFDMVGLIIFQIINN